MTFSILFMIALLIEAIWKSFSVIIEPVNWVKPDAKKVPPAVNYLGVMVVSVAICVASGADLFVYLDIPLKLGFIGSLATGIIISRGSNVLHDIVGAIGNIGGGSNSEPPRYS